MTRSCPLVVIGHVDHGKTALVRALTGMETDRLREEKERGLSIALGFAYRTYPNGVIDFIDAPGHEDFIRTMVAGAAGAQAALVVVSATEGVAPQTLEHLEIAVQLGITRGLVVLSKSDLVSPDQRSAVAKDVASRARAAGFSPDGAVFCSAQTGEGIEDLHMSLDQLLAHINPPPVNSAFFMPVDRVFSAHGVGTIVTGTVLGGELAPADEVEIGTQGLLATVRQLQIHGAEVPQAGAGQRVAVNLRGVPVEAISRGDVIQPPGAFPASTRLHGVIRLPMDPTRQIKHAQSLRVMVGTLSDIASIRLLDTQHVGPGETALAEFRFAEPVVTFAGQRAVLRRLSPASPSGGALILDPSPGPTRRRDPALVHTLTAAECGDVPAMAQGLATQGNHTFDMRDLARLARRSATEAQAEMDDALVDLGNDLWASRASGDAAVEALQRALDDFLTAHPTKVTVALSPIREALQRSFHPALIMWAERRLVEDGSLAVRGTDALVTSHDPVAALTADQHGRMQAIEAALQAGGTEPPDASDLIKMDPEAENLLEILIHSECVVSVYNHALRRLVYFHRDGLRGAAHRLGDAFPHGAQFKTGEARIALGTTRKFIVPLLEHFDTVGVTLRDGDLRCMAE